MKTEVQSSIAKNTGNRHPVYKIWGPFWGPFLIKQSVVCRSKMSLTCGPLKIVILAPSGHPKSIKCDVIFWWKFDRFSDDGDKQCIRINALFPRSWCYFSSSAVALLVGISKFKHIYEAELQLFTRLGLKMRSKTVSKKWFQRVPKWTPKVAKNRQKGCSGGVPKRDLKKVPSPGPGKVRFCCYLLHFSKVGGLKKVTFLGTILGPFGRQNQWNRVSDRGRKK